MEGPYQVLVSSEKDAQNSPEDFWAKESLPNEICLTSLFIEDVSGSSHNFAGFKI